MCSGPRGPNAIYIGARVSMCIKLDLADFIVWNIAFLVHKIVLKKELENKYNKEPITRQNS